MAASAALRMSGSSGRLTMRTESSSASPREMLGRPRSRVSLGVSLGVSAARAATGGGLFSATCAGGSAARSRLESAGLPRLSVGGPGSSASRRVGETRSMAWVEEAGPEEVGPEEAGPEDAGPEAAGCAFLRTAFLRRVLPGVHRAAGVVAALGRLRAGALLPVNVDRRHAAGLLFLGLHRKLVAGREVGCLHFIAGPEEFGLIGAFEIQHAVVAQFERDGFGVNLLQLAAEVGKRLVGVGLGLSRFVSSRHGDSGSGAAARVSAAGIAAATAGVAAATARITAVRRIDLSLSSRKHNEQQNS